MLITVYEHSNINVGKERDEDTNQISYEDRDNLLKKEFKDKKQNFYEKRYFQVKKIFEWNNSETIKTSSIVGTVKIDDDLSIEILPKIFNNNMDIKIARKNLIRLVEITKYEDIWDNETNIEEDAENIPYLEFIILRFTSKLLDELQKGIYAEYVTKIEESSFVRGAIQPHLEDIFDKSKIVCKFQELSFNNRLMQTFKTVAEHLLKNSMFSYEIKQNLFEITSILRNVESLDKLEIFDFENGYFNRLNESYETLFYQAKVIYFEYFPLNSDEDETTPYWAIYFDMDFLFEKFILHLLNKSGFTVTEQKKLYTYKNNYITPDFILYDEKIVIDSKYTEYRDKVIDNKPKNPNSKSIFQITNYMDNLNFEGSLIMIGKFNENILYKNQMLGKSFNVISLDMSSDFQNIIENFKFKKVDKKLDFVFDDNIIEVEVEVEKKSIDNESKDIDKLKKLADKYKSEKEWRNAIISYQKLLQITKNPNYKLKNLNDIAYCFSQDNNHKKAIEIYTQLIDYQRKNNSIKFLDSYYRNRAFAHRSLREYDEAVFDFQEAINLNNTLYNRLFPIIEELKRA